MAGRMTDKEKTMIVDIYKTGNYSIQDIANTIGRSVNGVSKVIEAYKSENPDFEKPKEAPSFETGKKYISKRIIEDTIFSFHQEGLARQQAEDLVTSCIPFLQSTVKSVDEMYNFVTNVGDASKLGKSQTDAGRKGIFVMTEALAIKAADDRKSRITSVDNENLFNQGQNV